MAPSHALLAATCCGGPDKPHDVRRRQILDAARRCFARSGFHGASMQEICAEAKMSPGGLYRYFRSKDDMIEAIAEDERIRGLRLLSQLSGDGDLTDRMVAVGMSYIREMSEPDALPLMAEVFSEGLRNSAIGATFLRNEREMHDLIRAFLTDLEARGEIRPIVALDGVISLMCGVIDGVAMRHGFDASLTPDRIAPQLRAIVTALLRPQAESAGTPARNEITAVAEAE